MIALKFAALTITTALLLLAVACTDDAESQPSDLPEVPTPVASFVRDNCEAIAVTDYFLSNEERVWFIENCNRLDCDQIRGTQYLSVVERTWYLEECT